MHGDTWQIRWKEFLSDSYVYGSKIEFNEDGSVSYKNRLMPPGTVIHTWYSMTNFQGKDDVVTLLIHLGYLSYHWPDKTVTIPNKEVSQE